MLFGSKKAAPKGTAATAMTANGAAPVAAVLNVPPTPTQPVTAPEPPVQAAPQVAASPTSAKEGRTRSLSKEDLSKIAERQRQRRMEDFGKIVSLLAREPKYQDMTLKDLEWLVMPAVASGQYMLAEIKPGPDRPAGPAAALLWARVSPEVEKKRAVAMEMLPRLEPVDWTSGNLEREVVSVGQNIAIARLSQAFRMRVKGRHS